MTHFHKIKTIVVFFCLFMLFADISVAAEARLTNFIVTNTRDELLIYLNVEDAFTDKIVEAILSGVPTTFSFYISLSERRNYWVDDKIKELKVSHTIKYNNLKKEFIISRSWESKPIVTQDIEEAKKLMTEIDSLKVISLDKLTKGTRYQISAKAELSRFTLPLYLHYVLFFVSLWDFETDWYTIDFIY